MFEIGKEKFMDRDFNGNRDLNNMPPYMDYMSPNGQIDFNEMYKDPFLNPMMQYEQACSYYRYLCLQMDYKIKCKEYERMCNTSNHSVQNTQNSNNSRDRKLE